MPRPQQGSYPIYFNNYISLVDADSVDEAANKYGKQVVEFFMRLPVDKADYRYTEDKWTLKEMLQHIIDAERIFAYRALTIARKDATPLPGFNENEYAENSKAAARTWESLLKEFEVVRLSTDMMLQTFDEEQLMQSGTTNNNPTTVNSIAFVIYGHILHHINIVNQRYL
jgi:uncharacterized damage-inducible protein DinB